MATINTKRPKQFQKLVSDKTMLEETIDRLDFLNRKIFIWLSMKTTLLKRPSKQKK